MARQIITLLALACLLPVDMAGAQTATPNAEQMIEQLKSPRTRGKRNLSVEATTPGAAGAAGAPAAAGAAGAAGAPAPSPAPADSAATASASDAGAPEASRPSLSLLIQFDFNSARVRPESQQALANLSQALQSPVLADSRFAIEGHTDAKGRDDYNRKLSEQRAQAVTEFLAARGVQAKRLSPVGKGASELANPADPFAAENRRVRIVNLD